MAFTTLKLQFSANLATGYEYDSLSRMWRRTDARGAVTQYVYDGLNRVTSVQYTVGGSGAATTPNVTYTYGTNPADNNNGRLVTMSNGSTSSTYTYDSLGESHPSR